MLLFDAITLEQKPVLDAYLRRYGEGSCQHSFVSLFCMSEKYGDLACLKDGYLFILRTRQCTEDLRVYLFPMGDPTNRDGLARAIGEILEDAHAHGARACFRTVTQQARDLLQELFPGRFRIKYDRDYAEYLYTYDRLANLPGSEMASKRHDLNTFYRNFGDRTVIEPIRPEHLEEILAFQKYWLEDYLADETDVQLDCENHAIHRGIAHFSELDLSGIVVFVDGKIAGYAYGAPLSDAHYDVIIEKGDRRIPDIYRVLNRELVRMCCAGYAYINREEDVGVEGLRKAKLSYKPDCFIEKYLATEVEPLE